ncbi:MAG: hypothetical protein AB7E98_11940 [Pirellulales bacterium]
MRVVIPSVNYADYLAVTLPAWQRVCPHADFAVVTDFNDAETAAVVCDVPNVTLVRTNAWTDGGCVLNKAAAMDYAFGFAGGMRPPPDPNGLCLALDADVYPFGRIDWKTIRPNAIYSVVRHECSSHAQLEAHARGELARNHFPVIKSYWRRPERDPAGLQGYFQLWRYRAGDSFGSFPTAARYDVVFGLKFPLRQYMDSLYVLHLGQNRKNWTGRVTPRWNHAAANADVH